MTYTASLNFRPELFDNPQEYEETPLRDRKRDLPNFTSDREKIRFIERVIALANTARCYGKSAYYLYGLDDSAQVYGLESSIKFYGNPDEIKTWESIRRKIKEQIIEYIEPLVDWKFEHGEKDGKAVAYLQIDPVREGPFRVKTPLGTLLRGQSWVRTGESKHPVCPTDDSYWYAASVVPYVLPSAWKAYFDNIWVDQQADLFRAQNIVGYQELYTVDGRLLLNVAGMNKMKEKKMLCSLYPWVCYWNGFILIHYLCTLPT